MLLGWGHDGVAKLLVHRRRQFDQPLEVAIRVSESPSAPFSSDDDACSLGLDTISAADVFVAPIGPDYLATPEGGHEPRLFAENDYDRLETGTALETGTRVIPVFADGATMPAPSDLPEPIRARASRHAHEVSPTRFRADVDQLITALDELTEEGAFGPAGSPGEGIEAEPPTPPKTSVQRPPPPLGPLLEGVAHGSQLPSITSPVSKPRRS